MNPLVKKTISELRDGLAEGAFSSVEITRAFLEQMQASSALNCYITETPELAEKAAKQSDERRKAGKASGLDGIPLAYKDVFCTQNVRTSAASHMLESFIPSYESTVTQKLKDEGTVMLGKLNHDEFAMGSDNSNSFFGQVFNPWRKKTAPDTPLVPGGSSGGSAASVAAGLCAGALGTDTGGSVRQPAAFCGVTGLKPSYGRCSRRGIIAFASSLDQAGPLGKNVRDVAILLASMAGHDKLDMTSAQKPVPDYEACLTQGVKNMRIGIPGEYSIANMPEDIATLWKKAAGWLKERGCEIIDISLPHTRYALPAYYVIASAEASSNLARYDGVRYGLRVDADNLEEMYSQSRAKGFGTEVKRRIITGTYVLSAGYYDAYYLRAQKIRAKIMADFTKAWAQCDAILAPVVPEAAFEVEAAPDPIKLYMGDVFTIPASLAGLPSLALPLGENEEGLPLGLQLIAKPFAEETILRAGQTLEEMAGFTSWLARQK